jgi:hypothetical protein
VGRHVPLLQPLIKAYEKQTVVPDQIVVAASDIELYRKELYSIVSEIPLTISAVKNKAFAGANRNRGGQLASGDLLIYNDADDLPHPQRVEITKYFFENHDIVHLNGLWTDGIFPTYNPTRIPHIPNNELLAHACQPYQPYCGHFHMPVHGGNVAVLKNVLDAVRWVNDNRGREDGIFCCDVLHALNRSMVAIAFLIRYRPELSAWKKGA